MIKQTILATVATSVIVGAGGFFGGTLYQKSRTPQFTPGQFQNRLGQSGNQNRNGTIGFRPANGEITNIDSDTITLKTSDGSSKLVVYSDSTKVNKTTQATKNDLKVGDQVMVIGNQGSDGTLTAESISVGGIFQQRLPGEQPVM